jgi:DNA-binding NtrC family response regulator
MPDFRVLIIDDEISLLKSLIAFLEDEDFDVIGATSGEEGLEILERSRIDAAIVDMRLPGMDGNETIIRAYHLQPDLRFIIHTGSTDYRLPSVLREIGIDSGAIFLKPLPDLTVLAEAVRNRCR